MEMRSASTVRAWAPQQLRELPRVDEKNMSAIEKAVPRIQGRRLPVLATASMDGRRPLGQAAAAQGAPVMTSVPMTLAEASSMLPGLQDAVEKAQAALRSGAKCPDVSAADLETAGIFKDQMTQFVAAGVAGSTLSVQKAWLDAGGKAVKCAIQAAETAPNTGAYVALGAVAMAAIVAFSV